MRRNRESAAQSRNRKKQYVDSLESEIKNLKAQINHLTNENYELRREHSRLTGAPPPMAPAEAISMLAPVDAAVEAEASAAAVVQPPGMHVAAIIADAHVTASVHAAPHAPSPRKTDALLGLELLSRSASINGGDADAETRDSEGDTTVEVMDATDDAGTAAVEPATRAATGSVGEVAAADGTASGSSSVASMVMDPLGTW